MLRATIYLVGLLFLTFVVMYGSEPRLQVWLLSSYHRLYGLIEHKYFVYKAGRLLKVPVRRLLLHDWSRFLPLEWKAYRKLPESLEWQRAWVCHVSRNDHHWQHWCTETETFKMPEVCVREMVADWMAISRTTNGVYGAVAGFTLAYPMMRLHESTRNFAWFLLQTYATRWEGRK